MEIYHCLLDRMQTAILAAQVLDGDNVTAIEGGKKADAGIDGFIFQDATVQAANEYGAGAAITLGAAFLASGQAAFQAKVVQQRLVRRDILDSHIGAIQQKPDFVTVVHRVLGVFSSRLATVLLGTAAKNPTYPEIISTFY
jgi:hypothetical protein